MPAVCQSIFRKKRPLGWVVGILDETDASAFNLDGALDLED